MSCATALIAVTTSVSFGIPIELIVARNSEPIAPKGGVMMVQLLNETPGDNWPTTLQVTFESGQTVRGVVGWIEKNPNNTSWTSNPSIIRTINSSDNTINIHPKDAITGPVLFIEIPEHGYGTMSFAGDSVNPIWVDLPKTLPNMNIVPINENIKLIPEEGDDTPEWNPQEYWRWTLVASRKGVMPPDPPSNSEVARLAALQSEHLWRIGFDRLARSSRGVAADCRDLLTNTTVDGAHSYACWVVSPDSLRSLISDLLDQSTTSRQLTMRALRWAENQPPHIYWLEKVFGSHITLAIANPTLESTLSTLRWKTENDIPIAIEVPANQTFRCELERGLELDLSIFGPEISTQTQTLLLSVGDQSSSLQVVPQQVKATPPSVQLATLYPLWNLQDVQRGAPQFVEPSQSTSVQIRKILGRWEIFIECAGFFQGNPLPMKITNLSLLRGVEAITILHPESDSILSISPSKSASSSSIPSDLHIYKSTNKHGWNVRIELPSAWVESNSLSFSVVRTHGNSFNVETGPLPCVPWNIKPTPIVIDLSKWDDIQRFPTRIQTR